MIPRILHMVWLGRTPMRSDNAKRFIELHPRWILKVWNEDNMGFLGLTEEVVKHGTFAGSSNIVRLAALYKCGGVYIDTDVEPIKPFDDLLRHRAFIARQPDGVFCNAVMGAEPEHIWIDEMLGKAILEQKNHDAAWACHMIEGTDRSEVAELPTDTFYPFGHDEAPKPPTERTLAVHKWDGSWLTAP